MRPVDTPGYGHADPQANRVRVLQWVEANADRFLALKRNKTTWREVIQNARYWTKVTPVGVDWSGWTSHVVSVMWASSYEQALDIDADTASGDCRTMFKRMASNLDRPGYERLLVHLENLLKSEESVVRTPMAFVPVENELSTNPLRGVW